MSNGTISRLVALGFNTLVIVTFVNCFLILFQRLFSEGRKPKAPAPAPAKEKSTPDFQAVNLQLLLANPLLQAHLARMANNPEVPVVGGQVRPVDHNAAEPLVVEPEASTSKGGSNGEPMAGPSHESDKPYSGKDPRRRRKGKKSGSKSPSGGLPSVSSAEEKVVEGDGNSDESAANGVSDQADESAAQGGGAKAEEPSIDLLDSDGDD